MKNDLVQINNNILGEADFFLRFINNDKLDVDSLGIDLLQMNGWYNHLNYDDTLKIPIVSISSMYKCQSIWFRNKGLNDSVSLSISNGYNDNIVEFINRGAKNMSFDFDNLEQLIAIIEVEYINEYGFPRKDILFVGRPSISKYGLNNLNLKINGLDSLLKFSDFETNVLKSNNGSFYNFISLKEAVGRITNAPREDADYKYAITPFIVDEKTYITSTDPYLYEVPTIPLGYKIYAEDTILGKEDYMNQFFYRDYSECGIITRQTKNGVSFTTQFLSEWNFFENKPSELTSDRSVKQIHNNIFRFFRPIRTFIAHENIQMKVGKARNIFKDNVACSAKFKSYFIDYINTTDINQIDVGDEIVVVEQLMDIEAKETNNNLPTQIILFQSTSNVFYYNKTKNIFYWNPVILAAKTTPFPKQWLDSFMFDIDGVDGQGLPIAFDTFYNTTEKVITWTGWDITRGNGFGTSIRFENYYYKPADRDNCDVPWVENYHCRWCDVDKADAEETVYAKLDYLQYWCPPKSIRIYKDGNDYCFTYGINKYSTIPDEIDATCTTFVQKNATDVMTPTVLPNSRAVKITSNSLVGDTGEAYLYEIGDNFSDTCVAMTFCKHTNPDSYNPDYADQFWVPTCVVYVAGVPFDVHFNIWRNSRFVRLIRPMNNAYWDGSNTYIVYDYSVDNRGSHGGPRLGYKTTILKTNLDDLSTTSDNALLSPYKVYDEDILVLDTNLDKNHIICNEFGTLTYIDLDTNVNELAEYTTNDEFLYSMNRDEMFFSNTNGANNSFEYIREDSNEPIRLLGFSGTRFDALIGLANSFFKNVWNDNKGVMRIGVNKENSITLTDSDIVTKNLNIYTYNSLEWNKYDILKSQFEELDNEEADAEESDNNSFDKNFDINMYANQDIDMKISLKRNADSLTVTCWNDFGREQFDVTPPSYTSFTLELQGIFSGIEVYVNLYNATLELSKTFFGKITRRELTQDSIADELVSLDSKRIWQDNKTLGLKFPFLMNKNANEFMNEMENYFLESDVPKIRKFIELEVEVPELLIFNQDYNIFNIGAQTMLIDSDIFYLGGSGFYRGAGIRPYENNKCSFYIEKMSLNFSKRTTTLTLVSI